jgi:uncharacterized membrane protein HdeD (DUF308 family)
MIDLTTMLINLSHSMQPVQSFLSGFGYVIGVLMVVNGFSKLKKRIETGKHGGHQENLTTGIAFIVGGAALIYLPSTSVVLSNTFFGSENILSYSTVGNDMFYHAMFLLIKTMGLVWFIRGTVLLVNASKPGDKHGSKGLAFLVAGVLAMNFDNTILSLNHFLESFFGWVANVESNHKY